VTETKKEQNKMTTTSKKTTRRDWPLTGIHARKAVQRLFRGLPVVDATRELKIHATDQDIKTAKRKDPSNCVFANACRRQLGSHSVAFFRHYAYVELRDSNGNSRIERFALPKRTRDSVMVFDRAGVADTGGFVLKPPSPGTTLDHKLEKSQSRDRREEERLRYKKRKYKFKEPDYRSGTGLMHFFVAEKNWSKDR
jgi:hypothetical protein